MPAWESAPKVDGWRNAAPVAKPPQYDPSAGGSTLNLAGFDTGIPTPQWLDRGLSGAGKAVSDLGSGIAQLAGANNQASIDEAKRLDAPLMNTGAGIAGNIAGNVAMMAVPGSLVAKAAAPMGLARTAAAGQAFVNPTTYLGAAGAGAATGALQPVATGDSRAINIGLGAVAGGVGQGVVNTLGRIAQPVQNALNPLRQKAVQTLQDAGVPLNLAQVTGSPMWNRISSALNDNLFTVGGQQAKAGEQKAAFTNAVSNLIGEDSPALTSDVMGGAANRINGVFSDVLNRNNVQPSPTMINGLAAAQAGALENQKQPVSSVINRLYDAMHPQTGEIPGQVAYGIKKDLDRMSSTADTTQNYYARQARSALMNGINDSLSPTDQAAFSQARGQFANMKRIEPALDKSGTGEVSPSILANVMAQKANRSASIYGQGPQDMVTLAQAGKQILPDQTPNSGTTARLMAAFLPGAAVAAGTQLATGDPMEAAKYGIGVMGLPKMAQWALNNPAVVNALSRGVTNPAARAALQAPANNALIGQTVRNTPNALARLAMPASE